MFTIAECRAKAEVKMALSKRDCLHRKKHVDAAEAWLFLASKLEDLNDQGMLSI